MPYFPNDDELREIVRTGTHEAVRDLLSPLHVELESIRRGAKPVYNAAEVGEMFGCSDRQVLEFHAKRGLRGFRPGKATLFRAEDINAYLELYPLTSVGGSGGEAKADE